MYLKHFGFNEFPFSLTPNLRFFCGLEAYKEALDVITVSLQNGEGFIKITGEVGTGKTLLCRKLLNSLGNEYVTVYIFNATLDIFNLQKAIAHELEMPVPKNIDHHDLITLITEKLISLHKQGKKTVIIVDEAHTLTDQTLEGLRLLSNLEMESSKLVQIVLVGQPELNKKLKKTHLRQLEQRIMFSYHLPTLRNKEELLSYICHRLAAAGYPAPYSTIISPKTIKLLFKTSRGIPRLVNILCHKAFLLTYGYNKKIVGINAIKMAIADTENVATPAMTTTYYYILKVVLISLLITITIGAGSKLLSLVL